MSQKQLSELMGCSLQYVSKVLKGQENLSFETISKIESCLGLQILPTSPYHESYASDREEDDTTMVAEDVAEYGK